jgi:hypothetical protein
MVKSKTIINKANNYLSPQIIEHKKDFDSWHMLFEVQTDPVFRQTQMLFSFILPFKASKTLSPKNCFWKITCTLYKYCTVKAVNFIHQIHIVDFVYMLTSIRTVQWKL